jgi:hypothetical protein
MGPRSCDSLFAGFALLYAFIETMNGTRRSSYEERSESTSWISRAGPGTLLDRGDRGPGSIRRYCAPASVSEFLRGLPWLIGLAFALPRSFRLPSRGSEGLRSPFQTPRSVLLDARDAHNTR